MNNKKNESYSDDEAQRRFDSALRGAFSTPPKLMKDIPRKRPITKRKPRTRTKASA
jgi:hypothetical protein